MFGTCDQYLLSTRSNPSLSLTSGCKLNSLKDIPSHTFFSLPDCEHVFCTSHQPLPPGPSSTGAQFRLSQPAGLPYLCRALSHLLDLILILHELSIQSRNLLVNGFCPAVHLEGKKTKQRQWYLLWYTYRRRGRKGRNMEKKKNKEDEG